MNTVMEKVEQGCIETYVQPEEVEKSLLISYGRVLCFQC